MNILQRGSKGPEVEQLQAWLVSQGLLTGAPDGAFGPRTESAVMAAQRALGLTSDGRVGPATRPVFRAAGWGGLAVQAPQGSLLFPRYQHAFDAHSLVQLVGVLPGLVAVDKLALTLCEYGGRVIPGGGLRTDAQAAANAAAGTGILDSLHKRQPDGFGHASDVLPLVDTDGDGDFEVSWDNKWLPAYRSMAIARKRAAAILGFPIRQGCDWDMDGILGEAATKEWDWPHAEYPLPHRLKAAEAELYRYQAELVRAGYDLRPESYPIAA